MGLLTAVNVITLPIEAVQKVLVLSCLAPGDPLKNVLVGSIMAIKKQWVGKVEVVVRYAETVDEFVEAINAFDGSVMVFDGHGAINHQDPVGYLLIGKEKVDVWQLRERVRVPPIVMLSACDTQGIDSSSHATVGNGFLALGARTVLATLLPVDGYSSGSLIARFIHRLAEFLPSAIGLAKRALNWTEIVAGMLRMLFASELLDKLVSPPAPLNTPRGKLQIEANIEINSGDPDWYDKLLGRIAAFRHEPLVNVIEQAEDFIARSEAIRYIQLGSPESILVVDDKIEASVFGDIIQRVAADQEHFEAQPTVSLAP